MTATALIIANNNPPRSALAKKVSKISTFKEVIVCTSGKDALKQLEENSVDMIFWALIKDKSDAGWVKKVQKHEFWRDIPLLVVAKETDQKSRILGLELGACDCVTYVTPVAELTARINAHLKRSQQVEKLRRTKDRLAQMALTDALTGLGNRATFDLSIKQESARTRRTGVPFSLLMIDLDHFKLFNDCYGHQAGDTVLKAVGETLQKTVRDVDIACRYGGEEFAVILPGTDAAKAIVLSERIHQGIAVLSKELWQSRFPLTVSIGITCADQDGSVHTTHLIEEADTALYQAKNNGRNRTEIYRPHKPQMDLELDFDRRPQLAVGS